jgi:hypothetical protein
LKESGTDRYIEGKCVALKEKWAGLVVLKKRNVHNCISKEKCAAFAPFY